MRTVFLFSAWISLVFSRFGIFLADCEQVDENDGPMKRRRWILKVATALLYLIANAAAGAGGVHTNPLNSDPLVREAYVHFYNLDFPGAVDRFERFHIQHHGDPQATAPPFSARRHRSGTGSTPIDRSVLNAPRRICGTISVSRATT